jgi:hypothetical protein
MQLRVTPAEREYKEKLNRKIKIRIRNCMEASLHACITKILFVGLNRNFPRPRRTHKKLVMPAGLALDSAKQIPILFVPCTYLVC